MKITRIEKVSGPFQGDNQGDVDDLADDFDVGDFDVIDETVIYRGNSFFRWNLQTMGHISVGVQGYHKPTSKIRIDRRRRILFSAGNDNDIVIFNITEDFDLEWKRNILLEGKSMPGNCIFAIKLDEKNEIMFAGVGYSANEKMDGQVYMIENYANESLTKCKKLFKQKEGVKAIDILRTKRTTIVFGGGTYYGIDRNLKIYDYRTEEFTEGENYHRRPIRDIVTFINPKNEELIVTCGSEGRIGIWGLDGVVVHKHDFIEMHSAMILVNHQIVLVCSNWGSVFSYDLFKHEARRVVEKDQRGSTAHVGRCEWVGKSNRFVGTCGDSTIRLYQVEGVERIYDEPEEDEDEDEKERILFCVDIENIEKCGIRNIKVGSYFEIPSIFFLL